MGEPLIGPVQTHPGGVWAITVNYGRKEIVRWLFADAIGQTARLRSGEIRVLDSAGIIERTIWFSEADRKLWPVRKLRRPLFSTPIIACDGSVLQFSICFSELNRALDVAG